MLTRSVLFLCLSFLRAEDFIVGYHFCDPEEKRCKLQGYEVHLLNATLWKMTIIKESESSEQVTDHRCVFSAERHRLKP